MLIFLYVINLFLFVVLVGIMVLVARMRSEAALFHNAADALARHNRVLQSVLSDENVPAEDKERIVRLSNLASSKNGAAEYLNIVEECCASKEPFNREVKPRYFDNNPALFLRDLDVYLTAMVVAGFVSGNPRRGIKLVELFISKPEREQQIVYKLDWQRSSISEGVLA